jgi:cobalamin biosynthesis Co2+ chelatase CbiK
MFKNEDDLDLIKSFLDLLETDKEHSKMKAYTKNSILKSINEHTKDQTINTIAEDLKKMQDMGYGDEIFLIQSEDGKTFHKILGFAMASINNDEKAIVICPSTLDNLVLMKGTPTREKN